MPWWMGSLLANCAIAGTEYLNRTAGFASPVDAFKVTAPLIVLTQVGLFYAFRDAPSFMVAWGTLFVGNIVLRVSSNQLLVGEPLSLAGWIGVGMIVAGAVTLKAGTS